MNEDNLDPVANALARAMIDALDALIATEPTPVGRARYRRLVARLRAGDALTTTLDDDASEPVVLRARLGVAAAKSQPPPAYEPMVCAADGSWFARGEKIVSLRRRPTLRRFLAVLIAERSTHAGVGISRDALLARAWPGERFAGGSGANRLYFAIAILRELGLRAQLVRSADGYMLDPSVPLDLRDVSQAESA